MSKQYDPSNILNSEGCVYVRYEVYAALQAENERLNERVRIKFEKIEDPMDEYLNHVLRKNCAKLEAENERLRKAGDAVIEKLAEAYAGEPSDFDHAHVFKAWLAAKGVQP